MAELQVAVPYKTTPGRVVFAFMCLTLPIWAVMAPAMLGLLIGFMKSNPHDLSFAAAMTGFIVFPAIPILGVGLTGLVEHNRIHLSKDGLSFPPFFLPKMQFRRARSWSELIEADFYEKPTLGGKRSKYLLLKFDSGTLLPLKLACCKPSDIEQLLLGIELWTTRCKRSEHLIAYQNEVQNQSHGVDQIGYTQMWQEELSRRFQATAFVPLEPNHELQNGRIKIIRQLAFGGFSAIYLAQENKVDLVTIKEAVVPPNADDATRANAEKQFVREANMLARIKHSCVARVLDHFIENGRHYLKLEYIHGQDLRQYVKQNGPVDQKTAIEWGLIMLDILQTLHNQDPPILHRDLTPENLVLTKDSLVLIDFGAANQFIGNATGTVVGKQAYIPVEQLRGKSVVESDIYAFGGTMYYLLTGKDPLPLSTVSPKELISAIDSDLDTLIRTCTAFEPEDRYHSATEVIEKLRAIQAASSSDGKAITSLVNSGNL